MFYLTWSNWCTGSIVLLIMSFILVCYVQDTTTLYVFGFAITNALLCYTVGVIETLDISDDDQSV